MMTIGWVLGLELFIVIPFTFKIHKFKFEKESLPDVVDQKEVVLVAGIHKTEAKKKSTISVKYI